jgi:putative membrane protein insertion efficiency factor
MRSILVGAIKAYRFFLSPWLGSACRFEPTCSIYALHSIEAHGVMAGSYLAACRLARCNPWCDGGIDPTPKRAPRIFACLIPSTNKE